MAFLAHEALLDSASSSRHGIYGLTEEVSALEMRVDNLGHDAKTEDLLDAVESLRAIRERYSSRATRPKTAPKKHHRQKSSERPMSAPPRRQPLARCTPPEPFTRLEADCQRHIRRRREERERFEAAKFEEERRSKIKIVQDGKPFVNVEKHQAEQDRRAALAREARAATLREESAQHYFKAKPVLYTENDVSWEQMQAEQDMRRSERVRRRAESTLAASAPILVEKQEHERRRRHAQTTKEEAPAEKRPEPEEVIKRLDDAHDRWCRSLEKAKVCGRAGTVPEPFFFEERSAEAARRGAQRAQKRRERREALSSAEETAKKDREKAQRTAARRQNIKFDSARQTYATYLRAQAVREKQRARREKEERELKIAEEREERLRRAAKRIQHELRKEDEERERNADELKQQIIDKRNEWRRNLKENKERYQRVAKKAPSLISRLHIETAKEKAKVQALKAIAKLVYGSTQGDWTQSKVDDMKIFTDEERLLLNIPDDNKQSDFEVDPEEE